MERSYPNINLISTMHIHSGINIQFVVPHFWRGNDTFFQTCHTIAQKGKQSMDNHRGKTTLKHVQAHHTEEHHTEVHNTEVHHTEVMHKQDH